MDRMRIVSLISAGTEMLYALGLGGNVVAVSHECDWPPECRDLPRVTWSNIDSTAGSDAIDRPGAPPDGSRQTAVSNRCGENR